MIHKVRYGKHRGEGNPLALLAGGQDYSGLFSRESLKGSNSDILSFRASANRTEKIQQL